MIYIITQHEQDLKNKHGEEDAAMGHNFLLWLAGNVLAFEYGYRYIYTPIIPEYMWTECNQFLGFDKIVPSKLNSQGRKHWFLDDIKNYEIIDIPKIPFPARYYQFDKIIKKYSYASISEDKNIILRLAKGQGIGIDWAYFLNNDLREKYDEARRQNPVHEYKNDSFINIACHIRRGDINPKDQSDRWITNEQYIKLFKNIYDILGSTCLIHVHSLGEKSDFSDIENLGEYIKLHLNERPIVAFHNLVSSDILINSKSAFSVFAAYLHKGIKFCIPFSIYWTNFPDWPELIPVHKDYNFDFNKLIETMEIN